MPLGAFRLNTIGRHRGNAVPPRDLSSMTGNTPSYSTGKFGNGHIWNTTNGTKTITLPTAIDSSSDWTVEFWIYVSTMSGNRTFPLGIGSSWYWMIDYGSSYITNNTTPSSFYHYGGPVLTSGAWNHVAFTYTGSTGQVKCWNNGNSGYNFSRSTALSSIKIGRMKATYNNDTSRQHRIDEIRISNNVRYTSSFTAPTAAFTNDENTVALFHCQSDSELDDNS